MSPQHLQYFKDLIEGKQVASWHPWWKAHDGELKNALSRQQYLRLKFDKVKAAAEILTESGIDYQWSAEGQRQAAYANLHPDAVDENGHPLAELRATAYGGALATLISGDMLRGHDLLDKFLLALREATDEQRVGWELADLEFDAEQLLQEGQTEAALTILRAVAQWETNSDLEMPAVRYAQNKLTQLGEITK